jgi:gas vesicle protein GvpL/GvpF
MALQTPPTRAPSELSTAVYCYGVTSAGDAASQPDAGVGGASVEPVCFRKLAALTSATPPGKVRARRADLLRHFDVLASAFEHGTVVPLRFGIVFDDEASLIRDFLEPRHDELSGLLRELRGRVELRVTAHYREDAVLAEIIRDSPRVARLREQTRAGAAQPLMLELGELVSAELQARTARDGRAILERLGSIALAYDVSDEQIEHQLMRASFLVERKRLKAFDEAMEALASGQAGRIDFSYVGPLPPHSFVNLEGRR